MKTILLLLSTLIAFYSCGKTNPDQENASNPEKTIVLNENPYKGIKKRIYSRYEYIKEGDGYSLALDFKYLWKYDRNGEELEKIQEGWGIRLMVEKFINVIQMGTYWNI